MNRRARSFTLALGAAAALAAAVGAAAQEQPAADAKIEDSGFNVPADTGYFDLRRITPITGDPARGQARSELCTACHGQDGISIVPIYPDIAGQKADYMYWQLRKFKDAGFGDTVMAVAVEDLTEQDMRDLSLYYAGLPAAGSPPEPAEPEAAPDPALLARGEQLYLHGDPTAGIPPCQACHGGDARGHSEALSVDAGGFTPYAAYPSLRGQREDYLKNRIAEYQQGKHTTLTTDFVMIGAARNLDPASVDALAAWLSSLPH